MDAGCAPRVPRSNLELLGGHGMRVVNELHALTHDGARYFGLLPSTTKTRRSRRKDWYGTGENITFETQSDHWFVVGLRNTHDRSYSLSLAVGNSVFACDNLSFSGEFSRGPQTHDVHRPRPAAVDRELVGLLAQSWNSQAERFAAYTEIGSGGNDAIDLLIELLDIKRSVECAVLPVLRGWRAPRHPAFVECGPTIWRLFNAVTEISKEISLFALPRRTTALHRLFDSYCGLMTAKLEIRRAVIAGIGQDASIVVQN